MLLVCENILSAIPSDRLPLPTSITIAALDNDEFMTFWPHDPARLDGPTRAAAAKIRAATATTSTTLATVAALTLDLIAAGAHAQVLTSVPRGDLLRRTWSAEDLPVRLLD
ncbi:hypothetical protein [Longispora urticae]